MTANELIGLGAVAILGSAGGAWALRQLWLSIWGQYAEKSALAVVSQDVEELKDGLHNLRNRAVTVEALKDRKEEVDRRFTEHDSLLNSRREDVRELHGRVDDLKDTLNSEVSEIRKDMNRGFQETQRLILERLK